MKLTRAFQWATVRIALGLLKASRAYDGYWNNWRGRPFDVAERMGLHVTPVHYYSPIPRVEAVNEAAWTKRTGATGIDLRLETATKLLRELAGDYGDEFNRFEKRPLPDPRKFTLANKGYGAGDAEVYYSMLRRLKPKRVIEIGCGHSTKAAALALEQNRAEGAPPTRYVCIEPFLPDYLKPPPDASMEIVEAGVQSVPIEFFGALEAGDILFIDSTHVAAIGSDVVYEFTEILPRLNPGVIIHVHDIFLPQEYPRDWIKDKRFFWNEQYLLHAFLIHNDAFEVMLPLHALFASDRDAMTALIPSLAAADARPASFWMKKKN